MAPEWQNHPVVFFDGVCNLCNGAVRAFLRLDRRQRLRFASLQSEAGQQALRAAGLGTRAFHSMLFHRGGRLFQHSDAVLEAAAAMGGPWRLARAARLVPRFLRDPLYRWVARNRYKWFGKSESCMVPTPGLKARFF